MIVIEVAAWIAEAAALTAAGAEIAESGFPSSKTMLWLAAAALFKAIHMILRDARKKEER